MNPRRMVYGRLTIQDQRIDLGHAEFSTMVKRLVEQYAARRYEGEKLRLIVEISDDPIGLQSLLSREDQLEAEQASLMALPNEEAFPGVSIARAAFAFESHAYQSYAHVCDPDKRIGVPEHIINQLREDYKTQFPDVFPHSPVWRN